jgi:hypothetical protein
MITIKRRREINLKSWHKNYQKNKKSKFEYIRKWRKSLDGFKFEMYRNIKRRLVRNPAYKHRKLSFSKESFFVFLKGSNYGKIHTEWVKSNYKYKMTPSVDRINNQGNYSIDNIQIITVIENNKKKRK